MQLHIKLHASAFKVNNKLMHLHSVVSINAMSKLPGKSVDRAWTNLLRAHRAALSDVEAKLKAAHLPPLAWYDVLLELDKSGNNGLRPFELQKALLLPQYHLSRLLERIEKKGYLERHAIAEDGRGQRLVISKSGVKIRKAMWHIYGPAIQTAVGERLEAAEASMLAKLLDKLIVPDDTGN